MKFGAHMSTGGGVWKALERGRSIQCEVVQIFVKNNMQWFGRPYTAQELELFQKELARPGCKVIFGHTSYLINLGALASANRDKSIKSLIQEIELATQLGLPFLVMHPGAHLGKGEAEGLKQIVSGLDEVFAATRRSPVKVALENTAGQGSCLGNKLEHLAEIIDRAKSPQRLGVCLDTAHLFAAGYDIRTQKGWDATMRSVSRLIGLKQVLAFHLNDSKTDLGSRVDRHAHIGQGKIGKAGFCHIVTDSRFKRHPGCLETPKSKDLLEDVENLKVLKSFCGKGCKRWGNHPIVAFCLGAILHRFLVMVVS
jgi:deoxyribonuclease-4